ncbi:MAG: glucose PTS transporter subunit IIA [Pseudoclavibacter sp.]|nr:glucose PTS transporter subunit IIA [Pseudoclavibacter sp.]
MRGRFGWVDYCFEFLSDTFRPILWALLGASLIITLLVLADTLRIQPFEPGPGEPPLSPGWALLHAMWRSVFYFLPIMVGASAARKLGADMWVGAAIPAAFLTPNFLGLNEHPAAFEILRIPSGDPQVADRVVKAVEILGVQVPLYDYSGQVFPALFAAVVLFWVEKLFKKIVPSAIQMVFVPFFSLLVMIPLTAFVVGPFGIFIGQGISNMLLAVNNFSPFVLSIVVPLIYPFLVPLGLHWPINAVMIQNIATLGYDFIQGPMGTWNFACFGLVAGVLVVSIRERNRAMRQVATGGLFAGLAGGISEPSLYGVVLRYKKTYLRLLPGCLVGGIVAGFFSIKASAFVFTSVLTIPAFSPIGGYVIAIAAAFLTSMLLVIFFDYRSPAEKQRDRDAIAKAEAAEADASRSADVDERARADASAAPAAAAAGGAASAAAAPAARSAEAATATVEALQLASPLSGRVVALEDVPDPAFASASLGPGCAVEPDGELAVSPVRGRVTAAFPTGHAVGLTAEDGTELLVHIGIDTVSLDGKGFELLVAQGDEVEPGTPLVRFDAAVVEEAGLQTVTPVLVLNAGEGRRVEPIAEPGSRIEAGEPLLRVLAE